MHTWAKRGVHAAIVTGGMLAIGSGVASADCNQGHPAPAGDSAPGPVRADGDAADVSHGQTHAPKGRQEASAGEVEAMVDRTAVGTTGRHSRIQPLGVGLPAPDELVDTIVMPRVDDTPTPASGPSDTGRPTTMSVTQSWSVPDEVIELLAQTRAALQDLTARVDHYLAQYGAVPGTAVQAERPTADRPRPVVPPPTLEEVTQELPVVRPEVSEPTTQLSVGRSDDVLGGPDVVDTAGAVVDTAADQLSQVTEEVADELPADALEWLNTAYFQAVSQEETAPIGGLPRSGDRPSEPTVSTVSTSGDLSEVQAALEDTVDLGVLPGTLAALQNAGVDSVLAPVAPIGRGQERATEVSTGGNRVDSGVEGFGPEDVTWLPGPTVSRPVEDVATSGAVAADAVEHGTGTAPSDATQVLPNQIAPVTLEPVTVLSPVAHLYSVPASLVDAALTEGATATATPREVKPLEIPGANLPPVTELPAFPELLVLRAEETAPASTELDAVELVEGILAEPQVPSLAGASLSGVQVGDLKLPSVGHLPPLPPAPRETGWEALTDLIPAVDATQPQQGPSTEGGRPEPTATPPVWEVDEVLGFEHVVLPTTSHAEQAVEDLVSDTTSGLGRNEAPAMSVLQMEPDLSFLSSPALLWRAPEEEQQQRF